jgi:hypothetical protein
MSCLIQSLEPRTLLSASSAQIVADELKIVSDARTARSDVFHYTPILIADAKSIAADLKSLANTSQNRSLGAKLKSDATQWFTRLKTEVLSIIHTGEPDARKAVVDGIAVYLNPSNTSARSQLSADLTQLQSVTSGPIAKLLSDAASARTAILSDLTAITAANPTATTLNSDVSKATSDTNTALNAASSDVHAIQTDVNTLISDLA